jgi:cytochrome c553
MSRSRKKALVLATALGLAAMLGAPEAGAVRTTMLQDVMKRMNGFFTSGNLEPTAMSLNLVKNVGPDEYKRWAEIAEKGRAAAAAGNVAATKAACASCHDQYRESYKTRYGSAAPQGKGPTPIER